MYMLKKKKSPTEKNIIKQSTLPNYHILILFDVV